MKTFLAENVFEALLKVEPAMFFLRSGATFVRTLCGNVEFLKIEVVAAKRP